MEDKKGKGFTVKDKRIFSENSEDKTTTEDKPNDSNLKNSPHIDEKPQKSRVDENNNATTSIPEINFSSFILSLSSSALFHFGEIPDPVTNKKQRNLLMAKQTIDILGVLKEKTAGNLTKEEDALFENLLHDLRIRFVDESKKEKS